jgi:hypothetical protein
MNMFNRGFEAPAHVHGKTHKKRTHGTSVSSVGFKHELQFGLGQQ